jgi:DNA-binding transcriptional LysR family regulator
MNFRTLDLNLLRVFDTVMAERNITRAATQLSMTQPAVSNALRRLREALNDELLSRSGFGVAPTARALALWPAVRAALANLEASIAPGQFDPAVAQHNFLLTMADATAAILIPPLIRYVEAVAPQVNLRVLPLTTRDPRALLDSGEADVAIGYFPAVVAGLGLQAMQSSELPSFLHHQIYSGEYVCVLRREHPMAAQFAKHGMSLDEFCAGHHLLVSFSGRPFGLIDEALSTHNRTRRIVLTVNQFFTAGQVVANSDLFTVLPRHFVASTGISDLLQVIELPFEVPPVRVDLLWHRHKQTSAAQQWMRAAIIAAAEQSDSLRHPPT